MRAFVCLSSVGLILVAFCLSSAQEKTVKKAAQAAPKAAAKPAAKPGAAAKAAPAAAATPAAKGDEPESNEKSADAEEASAEEQEIWKTAETFVKAYAEADAKAIAAHFTPDAEYVDEEGNTYVGRDAIEKNISEFFAANPGAKLAIDVESVRFPGPNMAIEDGVSTIFRADGSLLTRSRYVAIHAKSDGKWLAAVVREHTPKGERRHREQLSQLDWLVGEWVDEADDSVVTFNCRPVDNGNFLLREFTVMVAGQEIMSGSQRIGWDPLTGKLRAWTFDSAGGHFEGVWHHDGESWILSSNGVTADGETASGTSIFTFVNPHTITWQAVDHEIEGIRKPDSDVYTLVRMAPHPDSSDQAAKK